MFFALFLSFQLLTQGLQAQSLCQLLFAEHGKALAKFDAERIVDAIIALHPVAPTKGKNPYERFVIPAENIRTVHDYKPRPLADTTVVLSLPAPREKTVWVKLSPAQRTELLYALEARLRKGSYDMRLSANSKTSLMAASSPYQALKKGQLAYIQKVTSALDDDQDIEIDPRVGFSPRLMLAAANQGELVGVCRHGNVNLAALLGELGLKDRDMKLLTLAITYENNSADEIVRHLVLHVRHPEKPTDWIYLDATPSVAEGCAGIAEKKVEIEKENDRFLVPLYNK